MTRLASIGVSAPQFSPLVLMDRLLVLAREADRAGYLGAADQLVQLACAVCEEKSGPRH
jgi:hypothetical protein